MGGRGTFNQPSRTPPGLDGEGGRPSTNPPAPRPPVIPLRRRLPSFQRPLPQASGASTNPPETKMLPTPSRKSQFLTHADWVGEFGRARLGRPSAHDGTRRAHARKYERGPHQTRLLRFGRKSAHDGTRPGTRLFCDKSWAPVRF